MRIRALNLYQKSEKKEGVLSEVKGIENAYKT